MCGVDAPLREGERAGALVESKRMRSRKGDQQAQEGPVRKRK